MSCPKGCAIVGCHGLFSRRLSNHHQRVGQNVHSAFAVFVVLLLLEQTQAAQPAQQVGPLLLVGLAVLDAKI